MEKIRNLRKIYANIYFKNSFIVSFNYIFNRISCIFLYN